MRQGAKCTVYGLMTVVCVPNLRLLLDLQSLDVGGGHVTIVSGVLLCPGKPAAVKIEWAAPVSMVQWKHKSGLLIVNLPFRRVRMDNIQEKYCCLIKSCYQDGPRKVDWETGNLGENIQEYDSKWLRKARESLKIYFEKMSVSR